MNKAGLYAQAGFEYQKLAFIYFSLQMENLGVITYEGIDDIEITSLDFPTCYYRISANKPRLIQVKSGTINKEILNKVFLNWLLCFDKSQEYVCITENDLDIDYANQTFFDDLFNDTITTTKRASAIIKQVKNFYNGKDTELKQNLLWLISNAKFIKLNASELNSLSYELFEKIHTSEDEHEAIKQNQFEELEKTIRSKLADQMLIKEPYTLSYRNLNNIITNILSRINRNNYDVDFTEFKDTAGSKIDKLLNGNGDSIKQLKLVTTRTEELLIFLTEQIFYEDFRAHFIDEANKTKISSLEHLAHSNYEDVKFNLSGTADEDNPKRIFVDTTNKLLQSELFVSNSSNIKYYSRGCYIYLTDTGISEDIKIKWGTVNEED